MMCSKSWRGLGREFLGYAFFSNVLRIVVMVFVRLIVLIVIRHILYGA